MDERHAEGHREALAEIVRHADVGHVLQVDDVGVVRLPRHLFHGAVVVVARPQITSRDTDLGFAGLRIRIGRAKHGPVLSDEDSTLGPRVGRGQKERCADERRQRQSTTAVTTMADNLGGWADRRQYWKPTIVAESDEP